MSSLPRCLREQKLPYIAPNECPCSDLTLFLVSSQLLLLVLPVYPSLDARMKMSFTADEHKSSDLQQEDGLSDSYLTRRPVLEWRYSWWRSHLLMFTSTNGAVNQYCPGEFTIMDMQSAGQNASRYLPSSSPNMYAESASETTWLAVRGKLM